MQPGRRPIRLSWVSQRLKRTSVLRRNAALVALLSINCLGVSRFAATALAGANEGASASLSWAEHADVEDLTAIPQGRFPLFLKVVGTRRVQQLAIRLEWYPRTPESACYSVLSAAATDSCGASVDLDPGGDFLGDSSFTWSADLGGRTSGDLCVRYEFTGDSCGTIAPGRFIVTRLAIIDSLGQVDEIAISNTTTILAGEGVPQRLVVYRAGLSTLYPGATQGFRIVGWGFEQLPRVRLQLDTGESLDADDVSLESPASCFATFNFPDDFEGWGRLILSDARGLADTLATPVLVSDTTAATGSGVNGYAWTLSMGGEGGEWLKAPGESSWVFQPSVPDSLLSRWLADGDQFAMGVTEKLRVLALEAGANGATRPRSRFSSRRSTPSSVASSSSYSDTLLLNEDFEGPNGFRDPGWWVEGGVDGASNLTSWGVVDSACGRVIGAHSLHCAGTTACRGYLPEQGTRLTSRIVDARTDLNSRLTVDCRTWVDTDSIIDPAHGNMSDKLFAFISTDGGESWQVIKPGVGYAGRERQWLTRRLLDRASTDYDPLFVRVRVKFYFASGVAHDDGREGAYLDDIIVKGKPYPNLTFFKPSEWYAPVVVAPIVGVRNYVGVIPGQTNYFSYQGVNNSSASLTDHDLFHIELQDAHGVALARKGANTSYYSQYFGSLDVWAYVPPMCTDYYDLQVVLDVDGEIQEMNESLDDNRFVIRVPVVQSHPGDLAILGAPWVTSSGPASPCVGDAVWMNVAVVNNGGSWTSAGSELGLYENLGRVPTLADQPNQSAIVAALPPGGRDTVSFALSPASPGTRSYYFLADWRNTLNETCWEANNAGGPATASWAAPGADLAVTGLSVPVSSLLVGTSTSIAVTVANVGQGPTQPTWNLTWYRDLGSSPGRDQAGDRNITVRAILAPGADTTILIPRTSQASGLWRMYAQANVGGGLSECGRFSNNVRGPSNLTWVSDSLVVRGQVAYRDTGYATSSGPGGAPSGPDHYLRGARVQVFDYDDDHHHELLASTCTDELGRFAVAIPSRYDADEAGPIDEPHHVVDVFARVYLDADSACAGFRAVVVDSSASDSTWHLDSNVRKDVLTAELDLGLLKPRDYGTRSAMHLYETILTAAQRIRGYGFEPPASGQWRVRMRWEPNGDIGIDGSATAYDLPHYMIWVVGQQFYKQNKLTPDEWDDDVLLHEYAHHVGKIFKMVKVDTCFRHTMGLPFECGGVPSASLAWDEGWAMFAAAALHAVAAGDLIQDRGFNAGDTLYERLSLLETGSTVITENGAHYHSFVVNDSGPAYQESNAGFLWDLLDAQNDDQNGDGHGDYFQSDLAEIWSVVGSNGGSIHTIADFWRLFNTQCCAADQIRSRLLADVLWEHGMLRGGFGRVLEVADTTRLARPVFVLGPSPARDRVVALIGVSAEARGDGAPRVSVYDVAGRLVQTLAASRGTDAIWRAEWDLHDVSGTRVRPGVYFVRCRSGQGSYLKTMVVMQ